MDPHDDHQQHHDDQHQHHDHDDKRRRSPALRALPVGLLLVSLGAGLLLAGCYAPARRSLTPADFDIAATPTHGLLTQSNYLTSGGDPTLQALSWEGLIHHTFNVAPAVWSDHVPYAATRPAFLAPYRHCIGDARVTYDPISGKVFAVAFASVPGGPDGEIRGYCYGEGSPDPHGWWQWRVSLPPDPLDDDFMHITTTGFHVAVTSQFPTLPVRIWNKWNIDDVRDVWGIPVHTRVLAEPGSVGTFGYVYVLGARTDRNNRPGMARVTPSTGAFSLYDMEHWPVEEPTIAHVRMPNVGTIPIGYYGYSITDAVIDRPRQRMHTTGSVNCPLTGGHHLCVYVATWANYGPFFAGQPDDWEGEPFVPELQSLRILDPVEWLDAWGPQITTDNDGYVHLAMAVSGPTVYPSAAIAVLEPVRAGFGREDAVLTNRGPWVLRWGNDNFREPNGAVTATARAWDFLGLAPIHNSPNVCGHLGYTAYANGSPWNAVSYVTCWNRNCNLAAQTCW